ncbi:hypothetical protein EWM64_g1246 [Hericium alpestre]|uniref:TauD/TfdA-like domain-containing protein n=1 Tax=Hericium alpestre TaxID=135208 RepID=A0A4Z0A6T1_9AGAM|nr:hypothetical protein EWM64_g1246 [Hericium alpestre]
MVGFDLHALEESGAAWLLGVKGGGHVEAERGIWPCGYQKLAAATMATCFWAGDTFAPKLRIKTGEDKEMSVQQFLQNTFLDMWEVVARSVGDLEGVIGFEIMNEPHRGYIDLPSLHEFDYNTDLHLSHVPSALQAMMLGSGIPTAVGHWTRSFPVPTRLTSTSVLNSASKKAWRPDGPTAGRDLWEMHGVWGYDVKKQEGVVLRENYFVKDPMTGKKVDWYTDFYYPLIHQWTNRVRSASSSEKLVFLEPIPNEFCPASWTPEHQPSNMVYAPHWFVYSCPFLADGNILALSRGTFPLRALYWGHRGARENFSLQIRNIVEAGYKSLGEKPVLIGECGIPMDMNKGEAFKTDDWKWHARMMDAMIIALEKSLVPFTLWNYNPENDDVKGDNWNGENFSWFSRTRASPASQLSLEQNCADLDKGGRILQSVVRPYAAKTAGIPLRFDYEMTTGQFTYKWITPHGPESQDDRSNGSSLSRGVRNPPTHGHPPLTARETEIFVPSMLVLGRKLVVEGLEADDKYLYDENRQTLFILPGNTSPGKKHTVIVRVDPPYALFEGEGVRIGEDGVQVQWAGGHTSFYPTSFLAAHSSPAKLAQFHKDAKRQSWDAQAISSSPTLTLAYESLQSDRGLFDAMTQLSRYGLLFLTGVPNQETSDEGCEILHCVRNRVKGGNSLFVDALNVAEKLRRDYPKDFDILTSTPVSFHYINDGHHFHFDHPTIELSQFVDPQTGLRPVNYVSYAPPFQAPLSPTTPPEFYPALQRFASLLDQPEVTFEYTLKEGDAVIFDNRRVLHARTAFFDPEEVLDSEGKEQTNRWLKGCYFEADDLGDRGRILRAKLGL